jgi:hypothetical protein
MVYTEHNHYKAICIVVSYETQHKVPYRQWVSFVFVVFQEMLTVLCAYVCAHVIRVHVCVCMHAFV